MKLKDKIAIVTGAGSGIGRAIGKRFTEEGAKVVIADVNVEGLKETAAIITEADGQVISRTADVTKKADVQGLVDKAVETYGTLDIMVNNAGILTWGLIHELPEKDWDNVLAVNLKSVFLGIQAASKYWIDNGRSGKIVSTASTSGRVALPAQSHYCASKGGVVMLTRAAAIDLAPHKINVNCIAPGGTRTNIDPGLMRPEVAERMTKTVPIGRIAEPEDQAAGVVFLASSDADYVTGHMLVIDGGTTALMGMLSAS